MECLISVSMLPVIFFILGLSYLVIGVIYCLNTFDGVWEPSPTPLQVMAMYIVGILLWPIGVIRAYF
jgi:hypothetical protein